MTLTSSRGRGALQIRAFSLSKGKNDKELKVTDYTQIEFISSVIMSENGHVLGVQI